MKTIRSILGFSLALFLCACGGGGDSGGSALARGYQFQNAQAAPGGDGANPKQLRLTWSISKQPHHYRVELNPDGASGFDPLDTVEIAGDAASVELEAALHLQDWEAARYQLVALDAGGGELARSAEIPVAGVSVAPMIGSLQALNRGPQDAELFSGDRYGKGISLSASGDTLAVGKPTDQSGSADPADTSAPAAGAVFVYEREQDGWQAHYLKSNSPAAEALFGEVLALSGDGRWLAVGAPGESYSAESHFGGAVYLFERAADGWLQRSRIALDEEEFPTANFPFNLALSQKGDVLAAGSVFYGAFVYRLENGVAVESQVISRPQEDSDRAFAHSLAMSADGGILALGSLALAQSEVPSRVYLYRRGEGGGANWQQSGFLEEWGSGFGSALALSAQGDLLAVADINDIFVGSGVNPPKNVAAFAVSGAVYLYRESAGQWQEEAFIKASNNPVGATSSVASFPFGASVALSADGNVLVVGAPKESSDGASVSAEPSWNSSRPDAGAAYVYLRRNGEWQVGNYLKAPTSRCGELFGSAAALSADGRVLALAAVPEQELVVTPGAGGGAVVGMADGNCPGQSANEYPHNGRVYLY